MTWPAGWRFVGRISLALVFYPACEYRRLPSEAEQKSTISQSLSELFLALFAHRSPYRLFDFFCQFTTATDTETRHYPYLPIPPPHIPR